MSVVLSFHPEAQIHRHGADEVEVVRGPDSCLLQLKSTEVKQAVAQLQADGVTASGHLPVLERLLSRLGDGGFLCRTVFEGSRAVARLVPSNEKFTWTLPCVDQNRRYRLSRFACVRREGADLILETPLEAARVELKSPAAAGLLACLSEGARPGELGERGCTLSPDTTAQVLELLAGVRALTGVQADGHSDEDEEIPANWEFHDLLTHARSRHRISPPLTAAPLYRFGFLDPAELGRCTPTVPGTPLTRPDLESLKIDFTQVLEARRSSRQFGAGPVPLATLSEFLFRVAHPIEISPGVTGHPYPWGGPVYPELYVLAYRCDGLAPGLYHYHQLEHALRPVSQDWGEVEELYRPFNVLLYTRPPVAIIVASRFVETGVKYKSLAYTLQLKNAGALLGTMYLVATALGLAVTAVGTGDSDAFARLTGLNYFRHGSLAELVLGLPAG